MSLSHKAHKAATRSIYTNRFALLFHLPTHHHLAKDSNSRYFCCSCRLHSHTSPLHDAAKTITAYSLHIIFYYHQSHPITQPPCYDAHHRQISGAPRAVSPRSPPLKQIHGSTHDSMIVPINTAQKKCIMHVSYLL